MVEMAGGHGSLAADSDDEDDDSAPPQIRALPCAMLELACVLAQWPGYVSLSLLVVSALCSQMHQRCSWNLLLPPLFVGNRAYVPTKRVLFVFPSSEFAGSDRKSVG